MASSTELGRIRCPERKLYMTSKNKFHACGGLKGQRCDSEVGTVSTGLRSTESEGLHGWLFSKALDIPPTEKLR